MAYEDAFAIEDSNYGDIDDKDLAGLPVVSGQDSVSRFHLNSASNAETVVDKKRPVGKNPKPFQALKKAITVEKLDRLQNQRKENLEAKIRCAVRMPQGAQMSHKSS